MAFVIYFGAKVMPYNMAILAAMISRLLITGALHEDGLTDFMDGFGGGGHDRQRILDIMKDSRIGTYGVLGIIFYELLLFFSLASLPPTLAAITIFAADPYAKMIAGQVIQFLPYARTEEQSKAKNVYRRMNVQAGIGLAVQGLLPLCMFFYFVGSVFDWNIVVFVPCVVMFFLYRMIMKRLHGYTGDCCGALFLLTELSVYIVVAILWNLALKSAALKDIVLDFGF